MATFMSQVRCTSCPVGQKNGVFGIDVEKVIAGHALVYMHNGANGDGALRKGAV